MGEEDQDTRCGFTSYETKNPCQEPFRNWHQKVKRYNGDKRRRSTTAGLLSGTALAKAILQGPVDSLTGSQGFLTCETCDAFLRS